MIAPSGDGTLHAESFALFHAIAAGDDARVSAFLTVAPRLASEPARIGATRSDATPFFLDEIGHYVYAGDTALHVAAAAYASSLARTLVQLGASVNARNRRGAEPLHYACDGHSGSMHWNERSQAATVECLLAAGANPSAVDRSGVSPLHRAVRTRSAEAVRLLLDAGANVRQANGSGSTALHLAVQTTGRSGSGSAAARERQAAIVRLLLAHGARPTDRGARGRTVADSASSGWVRALLRS